MKQLTSLVGKFQNYGKLSSLLIGAGRSRMIREPCLTAAALGSGGRRYLVTSPVAKTDAEMVDVTFVKVDGTKISTKGKVGDNLLDVVVNNSVDLDGFGACEGTLSCSTCHVIFKKEDFDKIQEKLTDEEMDMLDLAFGLTDTSRLGCQVCLRKELAGVEVRVPEGVNDARS